MQAETPGKKDLMSEIAWLARRLTPCAEAVSSLPSAKLISDVMMTSWKALHDVG